MSKWSVFQTKPDVNAPPVIGSPVRNTLASASENFVDLSPPKVEPVPSAVLNVVESLAPQKARRNLFLGCDDAEVSTVRKLCSDNDPDAIEKAIDLAIGSGHASARVDKMSPVSSNVPTKTASVPAKTESVSTTTASEVQGLEIPVVPYGGEIVESGKVVYRLSHTCSMDGWFQMFVTYDINTNMLQTTVYI